MTYLSILATISVLAFLFIGFSIRRNLKGALWRMLEELTLIRVEKEKIRSELSSLRSAPRGACLATISEHLQSIAKALGAEKKQKNTEEEPKEE